MAGPPGGLLSGLLSVSAWLLAPRGQRAALSASSGACFLFGRENRKTPCRKWSSFHSTFLLALACGDKPTRGDPRGWVSPTPSSRLRAQARTWSLSATTNPMSSAWLVYAPQQGACSVHVFMTPRAGFLGLPLPSSQPSGLVAPHGSQYHHPRGPSGWATTREKVIEYSFPPQVGSPFIHRV